MRDCALTTHRVTKELLGMGNVANGRPQIQINGKHRDLGLYETPEGAFIAYMKAAWDHFGDYAKIDTAYLKAIRDRKAKPGWERDVLMNLARPDYLTA
jgi:hypothetical protein